MKEKKTGYLYIMPLMVMMAALIYAPIISTLYYSFTNINLLKPGKISFIGLDNFTNLLKDAGVQAAVKNSLLIAFLVIVLTYIIGLAFALLIKQSRRLKGVLTAAVIIPWAIPGIVSGIIWRWLFHPGFGLFNSLLLKAGVIGSPVQWFSNNSMVIVIVALTVTWRAVPLVALTLLAALQAIPKNLYEAAAIDGCGAVKAFLHITQPLLRPSVLIALTTTTITAVNVLDEIVSLVGISTSNNTFMTEIYMRTFKYMRFSEGSALSYIVMFLCIIIWMLYTKILIRKERVEL